jgi:hypothetical protein
MGNQETDETRMARTEFSDPSRLDPGSARDSMEASLAEMERARSSQPAPQHGDDGNTHTTGGHPAATRNTTEKASASQARDIRDQACKAGEDAARGLSRRAVEEPWLTLGVGFAVGYLVAYLTHGGRRWG